MHKSRWLPMLFLCLSLLGSLWHKPVPRFDTESQALDWAYRCQDHKIDEAFNKARDTGDYASCARLSQQLWRQSEESLRRLRLVEQQFPGLRLTRLRQQTSVAWRAQLTGKLERARELFQQTYRDAPERVLRENAANGMIELERIQNGPNRAQTLARELYAEVLSSYGCSPHLAQTVASEIPMDQRHAFFKAELNRCIGRAEPFELVWMAERTASAAWAGKHQELSIREAEFWLNMDKLSR